MKINLKDIPDELSYNGVPVKRLIRNGQESGRLANVNYVWLEKGVEASTHVHDDSKEFFFFLEGSGTVTLGNKKFSVAKDDFIVVPKGISHAVHNPNQDTLCFISIRITVR